MIFLSATLLLSSGLLLYKSRQRKFKLQLALSREQINREKQALIDALKVHEDHLLEARFEAQRAERKRIAGELHDNIGSLLASVKLYCGVVRKENPPANPIAEGSQRRLESLVDQACNDVRSLSHIMSAKVSMPQNLEQAIAALSNTVTRSGQLQVDFEAHGLDHGLPDELATTIYRVVQELVANTIKHAEAKTLRIQITRSFNNLNLLVEDDGKGFSRENRHAGLGLENIQNRLQAFDSQLYIDSTPGMGSIFIADFNIAA